MVERKYDPQSYRWGAISILLPDDMAGDYDAGKAILCDIATAKDGNRTLVRVRHGSGWLLQSFRLSGEYKVLVGDVHAFAASSGSWSGGSHLDGAVAMRPGAILRVGAKGNWSYLVASETEIVCLQHNPLLFSEEAKWTPLA